MRALTFSLPWPPSVNHMWGYGSGRVFLKEEGRSYRKACADDVLVQRVPRHQLAGRLSVSIIANPPNKRRRDMDNVLKAALDALTHCGVIQDDEQFDRITIERGEPQRDGRLWVQLCEIKGE